MNDMSNIELSSRRVIATLDPTLRSLLATISQFRDHVASQNNVPLDQSYEEKLHGLLKSQAEILKRLKSKIEDLSQYGEDYVSCLIMLCKYVCLPLNSILAVLHKVWDEISLDGTTIIAKHSVGIRQSIMHTVVENAAETIHLYVSICESHQKRNSSTSLLQAEVKQLLISLALILPMQPGDEQNAVPPHGKEDNTLSSLDNGSDAWRAVLQAVKTTCGSCNLNDANAVDSFDESLMIRTIDVCSAYISPSSANRVSAFPLVKQSMETLKTLLATISNQSMWRNIFPGVFTAIYRTLRWSQAQTLSIQIRELQEAGLDIIILLLDASLPTQSDEKQQRSPIQQFTSLPFTSHANLPEHQISSNHSTDEGEFALKLNSFGVVPIRVLMNGFAASTSNTIRCKVVELCRYLLLKTSYIWTERSLVDNCVDVCLQICQDSELDVSNSARQTFVLYQAQLEPDKVEELASRIIGFLSELPTVVQRQKHPDTHARISMITAYLQIVAGTTKRKFGSLATTNEIVHSLSTLVVPNLETLSPSDEAALFNQYAIKGSFPNTVSFQCLDHKGSVLIQQMLSRFGEAIGHKRSAIVVDTCIAEFYSEFIKRDNTVSSMINLSQTGWVQSVIGYLVVARQVLLGGFGDDGTTLSTKVNKVVRSLTTSISPIIGKSILWEIPCLPHHSRDADSGQEVSSDVSIILEANSALVQQIIKLAEIICCISSVERNATLAPLYYLIIEKTGQLNPPSIRASAIIACTNVAKHLGFDSVAEFISCRFNFVAGNLKKRFRVSISKSGSDAAQNNGIDMMLSLVCTILATSTLHGRSNTIIGRDAATNPNKKNIVYMVDTISYLTKHIDPMIARNELHQFTLLSYINVGKMVMEFLHDTYEINPQHIYSYKMSPLKVQEPTDTWKESLATFLITSKDAAADLKIADESTLRSKSSEVNNNSEKVAHVSDEEIRLVSLLISRCGYYLSHPSLDVKILSCDVVSAGFKFLAFVGSHEEQSGEENEEEDSFSQLQNSILRQVAEIWPTFKAKMTTTSDSILLPSSALLVVRVPTEKGDVSNKFKSLASERWFLVKLFILVGSLAEGSGEFFARRFRDDVWPILKKHFQVFVKELAMWDRYANGQEISLQPVKHAREDSERALLAAMIDCLHRVFSVQDCGEGLLSLIPSAAHLLFPFLDDEEDTIGVSAFRALQVVATLDSTSLLRPLLHMSGHGMPACPIQRSSTGSSSHTAHMTTSDQAIIGKKSRTTLLQQKASSLIQYLALLPERKI